MDVAEISVVILSAVEGLPVQFVATAAYALGIAVVIFGCVAAYRFFSRLI